MSFDTWSCNRASTEFGDNPCLDDIAVLAAANRLHFLGVPPIVGVMAASSGPLHRLCLDSWELLQTFRGATIPREGETVVLEREGRETTYRVTQVRYKLDASGEMAATVFVKAAS